MLKRNLSTIQKIELTAIQAKIIESLGIGKENAIRLDDLRKRVGLSERYVRLGIISLRNEGYPILSSVSKPYGYYFCGSEAEGQAFLDLYLSYIKDLCVTRQAVKMALKQRFTKSFGQLPMNLT